MTIVTVQKDTPFSVDPKAVLNAAMETNPSEVVVITMDGNGKVSIYSSCSGEMTDQIMMRGDEEIGRLTSA